jgi:glycerol dehydrogenase
MVEDKIISGIFDVVVGVGGGKAIDTAKAAADKAGVSVVTVPTIAGTCAATTALSVVYNDHGAFEEIYYLKRTPVHAIIDLEIISKTPWRYLWAGIGDTIAKYYEVDVTQGNDILSYNNTLGRKLSSLCVEPLLVYGVQALDDIKAERVSFALEQVVMHIVASTGFVSFLVDQKYNGAAAHGLFYGLTLLEEIEKNHLHGEVVGYGVLVLLKMTNNQEELERLYDFYKKAGLPTCLVDLGISLDDEKFEAVLEKALNSPDMNKMPYKVTREMVLKGIEGLENYK